MTPLIDVVFQLLIFFICASTGHMKELLLPTDFRAGAVGASAAPEVEKPLGEVAIRLMRTGDQTVAYLQDREFTELEKLSSTLRALANASTEIPVTLDISGDVVLGDVIYVYDVCRAARFQSVNFAVSKQAN